MLFLSQQLFSIIYSSRRYRFAESPSFPLNLTVHSPLWILSPACSLNIFSPILESDCSFPISNSGVWPFSMCLAIANNTLCKRSSRHFLGRKIRGYHEKSYFCLNIYGTYYCENKCPTFIHKLECAKRNLIFKTHIPRSQILVCRCNIWGGVWSSSFSQAPQVILKVVGLLPLRNTAQSWRIRVGLADLSPLQSRHSLENLYN